MTRKCKIIRMNDVIDQSKMKGGGWVINKLLLPRIILVRLSTAKSLCWMASRINYSLKLAALRRRTLEGKRLGWPEMTKPLYCQKSNSHKPALRPQQHIPSYDTTQHTSPSYWIPIISNAWSWQEVKRYQLFVCLLFIAVAIDELLLFMGPSEQTKHLRLPALVFIHTIINFDCVHTRQAPKEICCCRWPWGMSPRNIAVI